MALGFFGGLRFVLLLLDRLAFPPACHCRIIRAS
jgi:hypothetical protein